MYKILQSISSGTGVSKKAVTTLTAKYTSVSTAAVPKPNPNPKIEYTGVNFDEKFKIFLKKLYNDII